jgi:hypothetical protein
VEQPAVAAVEQTYADEITLIRLADVDVWAEFGVMAQPAFAFVDDSGEMEIHHGSLDETELSERIEALISG